MAIPILTSTSLGPTVTGTLWWDFDGTLVHRPSMWTDAGYLTLARHRPDLARSPEQFHHPLSSGLPWQRSDFGHPDLATADAWWQAVYHHYADVFSAMGWPISDAHAALPDIRRHILDAEGYTVFDDVVPVLSALQQRGWRHLVVSNHVPELPALIERLGLASFFDAVISSGVVGYEKPHRRMFETARQHTAGDQTIWMIGDNPIADCAAATAFGVKAVLVRTAEGFEPRVDDLWGVLRLLVD